MIRKREHLIWYNRKLGDKSFFKAAGVDSYAIPAAFFCNRESIMRKILLYSCVFALVCLSFLSCKDSFQTFEYTFSIESVSNYKMTFSFDHQKNYKTEVQNYFMDRRAHTSSPKIREGRLTDEQYTRLCDLVKESDLLDMKDMYGFDDARDEDGLLTQIVLTVDGETKYISIRNLSRQKFGKPFQELMKESVDFINQKGEVER